MNIIPLDRFQHLATDLIGLPYVHGGRSPRGGFDCWGLVWYCYKQIGIDIAEPTDYSTRSTFEQKSHVQKRLLMDHCVELDSPQPGCIVSFSRGGFAIHCGLFIDSRHGCLHATEFGIVCEKLTTIKQFRNLNAKFYIWQ